jgi:signal transduction histidine kinase
MAGEPLGTPLRHRVLVSILTVTTLAVVLFALPLAVAVQRLYRSEAIATLQEKAARAAVMVPDNLSTTPGQQLAEVTELSGIGVYDVAGHRLAGAGPDRSALATGGTALSRVGVEGSDLAVIAPIPSDQKVAGTVRASMPYSDVTHRVYRTWAAMALFAAIAIGLGAVIARRQALRLAAPLEQLTHAARALGDGDFSVRAQRSGLREADTASQALEDTAVHLGRLLDRERAFSSDVSHQLRTPLTALRVGLESAVTRPDADPRTALKDALTRSEHLSDIVEDLVSLLRQPGFTPVPVDAGAVLTEVGDRWQGPLDARGRPLVRVVEPQLPRFAAPPAALRQILDVLLSNALWHGEGTVTMTARQVDGSVAIDVSDEGPGMPDSLTEYPRDAEQPESPDLPPADDGHGRGLPLARSLATAAGGSLVVSQAAPRPAFTVTFPVAAGSAAGTQLSPGGTTPRTPRGMPDGRARLSGMRVGDGELEAVAATADRGDVRDGLALEHQLAAQRRDMHVQRLGRPVPVVVPHARHQLVAGDDLPGTRGQHREQVKLLGPQHHLGWPKVGAPREQVQPQDARLDGCPLPRGGPAPQVRAQPGQQLGQPERLGQVVVGAGVQGDDHVQFPGPGGQHDDHRIRRRRAQAAAQRDSVDIGQAQVEEHQVWRLGRRRGHARRAVAGEPGSVPVAGESLDELGANGLIVLDDQNPGITHAPDSRPAASPGSRYPAEAS